MYTTYMGMYPKKVMMKDIKQFRKCRQHKTGIGTQGLGQLVHY